MVMIISLFLCLLFVCMYVFPFFLGVQTPRVGGHFVRLGDGPRDKKFVQHAWRKQNTPNDPQVKVSVVDCWSEWTGEGPMLAMDCVVVIQTNN